MSEWCGLGNMALFFLGSQVTSAICARYSAAYNRQNGFSTQGLIMTSFPYAFYQVSVLPGQMSQS